MQKFNASVIDLFCGVGGLTYGFRKEGFNVVAGVDIDKRCRHAYERNNAAAFLEEDVAELAAKEIEPLFPRGHIKVLAGCAPCQPFSIYRNGKTRGEKWKLLNAFGGLIRRVRPEVVTMENVPQLVRHDVLYRFIRLLEESGYWCSCYIVDSHLYGVPQKRRRLVLFASRLGAIEIIPPTNGEDDALTVREAIGDLEPLRAGEASTRDSLHRARNLSELNQKRIATTKMGGWWRDWDESLILKCHKKKKGKTYRTVYGRMHWNRPSPTITTQCVGIGNGQFGHPKQDRAITCREAALLQTFPKKYEFVRAGDRISMEAVALHIGNAVPVRLAQIVARSIKKHLRLCGAV